MKKVLVTIVLLGMMVTGIGVTMQQTAHIKSDKMSFITVIEKPLNVRNNNPCNIKYVKANDWIGSIYTDGIFEQFANPYYGLRACGIVLNKNIMTTDSVAEFVLRFATEPDENLSNVNIYNYMKHIQRVLGYKTKIRDADVYKLMEIVIQREGGNEATDYFAEALKNYSQI